MPVFLRMIFVKEIEEFTAHVTRFDVAHETYWMVDLHEGHRSLGLFPVREKDRLKKAYLGMPKPELIALRAIAACV